MIEMFDRRVMAAEDKKTVESIVEPRAKSTEHPWRNSSTRSRTDEDLVAEDNKPHDRITLNNKAKYQRVRQEPKRHLDQPERQAGEKKAS
jgi:hypothetical protein